MLQLPVLGQLVRTINVSRFARTLGTMLQSGVPMLRALETAKQIVGNVILQQAIDDAKKAVTEGESLAQTLKKSGQFPATMIHMVAVGEKAGQLEQMLERVAATYEAEVDTKLSRFTALLEPHDARDHGRRRRLHRVLDPATHHGPRPPIRSEVRREGDLMRTSKAVLAASVSLAPSAA